MANYHGGSSDGSIAVLLGNGDGTLGPPLHYQAGRQPNSLAVADVTGEGVPDIVVSSYADGTVNVLRGRGDGTFEPPIRSLVGSHPFFVTLGDFNQDGKQDVAVMLDLVRVAVLLGNGNGTFQRPTKFMIQFAGGIAAGDFDHDGILDLAIVGGPSFSDVSVLLGRGDGTFGNVTTYTTDVIIWALVAEDLNNDGWLDLVGTALGYNGIGTLLSTAPPVTLLPEAITFPTEQIGDTSPPRAVKLSNTSSEVLSISSIAVSGDFVMKNMCGTTVAPGASCNVSVAFRPRASGMRGGLVTITDSAPTSPQKGQLTGTGQ